MAKQKQSPRPLFDTLDTIVHLYRECQTTDPTKVSKRWLTQCFSTLSSTTIAFAVTDFIQALNFLHSYRGSIDTFNAYRRELERLIQWSWFIQEKSILEVKRADIEAFIEFCQNPDKNWVGTKTVARFIDKNGLRMANQEWRPFIVKVSKRAFQDGDRPESTDFQLSSEAIKQIFAILGSFYNYLIQEEVTEANPILLIRQKSKYVRKQQGIPTVRRLSDIQWRTVLSSAQQMAEAQPSYHERTLFIIEALYGMYLRISELVASDRWIPMMQHFYRDANGDWWFKTVGKGNKMRQIAVSTSMLEALKRWRHHLQLPTLPSPDEQTPLIPKMKGKGAVRSTRAIRMIVQLCFDKAIRDLQERQALDEAEMLRSVTVHWLRHTGISDDVKIRPREHVRDDAGHSSSAITDRYIDVELKERAKSAKKKSHQVEMEAVSLEEIEADLSI